VSDELLNASFAAAGKTYNIEFSDWDCRQLKKLGFDVYKFTEDETTMRAIFDRSALLSDVLLYCCGISDDKAEAFLKSLDLEALEGARKAVENAIVNFSPASTRLTVIEQFSAMRKALADPEILATIGELPS